MTTSSGSWTNSDRIEPNRPEIDDRPVSAASGGGGSVSFHPGFRARWIGEILIASGSLMGVGWFERSWMAPSPFHSQKDFQRRVALMNIFRDRGRESPLVWAPLPPNRWSFTSGCSTPRLAATQLPSVTGRRAST